MCLLRCSFVLYSFDYFACTNKRSYFFISNCSEAITFFSFLILNSVYGGLVFIQLQKTSDSLYCTYHCRFVSSIITRNNIHYTSVIIVFYVFTFIHMRYLLIGDTTNFHLCAIINGRHLHANRVPPSNCGSNFCDPINKLFQISC